MKIYQLQSEQIMPISLSECWSFFSNPANLQKITPKEMGFTILSGADKKMYSGQLIQYKVSPVLGIKIKWVSEIKAVSEGVFFIDEQRFGPYKFWYHQHFFEVHENGVKMTDIVSYGLPFGILGRIAQKLFVGKKLMQIFQHRKQSIKEFFG